MISDKDLYCDWLAQQDYEEGNEELAPLRCGYDELEEMGAGANSETNSLSVDEIKRLYF